MMDQKQDDDARPWQFSVCKFLILVTLIGTVIGLLPLTIQGNRIALLGLLAILGPVFGSLYVEFIARFVVQVDEPFDNSSI